MKVSVALNLPKPATKLIAFAGTREARNVELDALRLLLTHLAAYVQSVADDDPRKAAAIILSAGMYLKARSIRSKAPFNVVQGDVSAWAKLTTKSASDRALYAWLSWVSVVLALLIK